MFVQVEPAPNVTNPENDLLPVADEKVRFPLVPLPTDVDPVTAKSNPPIVNVVPFAMESVTPIVALAAVLIPALLLAAILLNVVPEVPPMICVVPSKVTVPVPPVKVPPLLVQFPETVNEPVGAISVPLLNVILVASTMPVDPVNVPTEMVNPPLKVCVAVEAW